MQQALPINQFFTGQSLPSSALPLWKGTVPVSSQVPRHVRAEDCTRRPRHSGDESRLHQLRQALIPPPHRRLPWGPDGRLPQWGRPAGGDTALTPAWDCFLHPPCLASVPLPMLFLQPQAVPSSFCPG